MPSDPSSTPDPLQAFLEVSPEFHLGKLVTEATHPRTAHLSELAAADPAAGAALVRDVDLEAAHQLAGYAAKLVPLARAVRETLDGGGRIFLCGCGATGRLSVSLEIFARTGLLGAPVADDRVIGFMAGGDAALIRSIESFEDHPEWGARMLRELGFREGDLLVSTTEGGETPYVIGATEAAVDLSRREPFFLHCNPDDILARAAERSRRVLGNARIHKINLTVGPMAISGSTRMQSSTVLMAAVGWAFMARDEPGHVRALAEDFLTLIQSADYAPLAPFVVRESEIYRRGGFVFYDPGPFGITVMTDTTERSPTFSIAPFENQLRPDEAASLCHLLYPDAPDAASAWRALLHREPRGLEWDEMRRLASPAIIAGYDFSGNAVALRERRTGGAVHHRFRITGSLFPPGGHLHWSLDDLDAAWPLGEAPPLHRHLLLKVLLNTHSTLVMGRLGRYEGNLMTYVSPSNYKLIDRAIRYAQRIAARRGGSEPGYEETARVLFAARASLKPGESVVLRTVEALVDRAG